MTINPPTELNKKYNIIRLFGNYGEKQIYVIRNLEGKKEFILKEFVFPSSKKEERINFLNEADILTQISHPGIIKTFETFNYEEKDYLVIEYIKGRSLEEIINASEKPLPIDISVEWIIEASLALDYLHNFASPIIFRYLKPSNIIITKDYRLKLIDLRITGYYNNRDADYTGYEAPETAKNIITEQSDIFSLGVILYQMVTKYYPELNPLKFPDIKTMNYSISDELARIINKAIEINPEKRYKKIKDFREELKKYLEFHLENNKPSPKINVADNEQLNIERQKLVKAEKIKAKKKSFFQKILLIIFSILVIGSLISIKYVDIRNKKMEKICENNIKNIITALNIYAEDNTGMYPATLKFLTKRSLKISSKIYGNEYLEQVPYCPASGNFYHYKTNYETFTLYCEIHKGQEINNSGKK